MTAERPEAEIDPFDEDRYIDELIDRHNEITGRLPDNRFVHNLVSGDYYSAGPPLIKRGDFVIPDKAITVVYGLTTAGKSFAVVDLACSLATGEPWLGAEDKDREAVNVLYVQLEGHFSQIAQRVEAWRLSHPDAPHPLDRLHIVRPDSFDWDDDDDIDDLRELAADKAIKARVLVIDTLDAGRLDGSNMGDEQVGRIYTRVLPSLAYDDGGTRDGMAVILVAHSNARDDSIAGLSRQANAAEAIVHIRKQGGHRIAILEKSKVTDGQPKIAFDIVDSAFVADSGPVGVVRPHKAAPLSNADAEAAEWLRCYLTEHGGQAASKDVKAAAAANGYSDRRLRRARDEAGVEVVPIKGAFPRLDAWVLQS